MKSKYFVVATFVVAGIASLAIAADANTKKVAKGEKPKASPGWVVIEEDWWYPLRYDFLDSLHKARVHYRAKEEKAAAAEIDKAITWLQYAQDDADKATAEELATARMDLTDFAMALRSGKPIKAKNLDAAFAHASAALAKHHHFKSQKALDEGDLKSASRHLMAAVDHVQAAARSVNHEYGSEFVTIYDDYAPFGYWDETIVMEKNKLEANLMTVKSELEKLSSKLKSGK